MTNDFHDYCFCPGEYIRDEIEARGMTIRDLAEKMPGDADHNNCALDFLLAAIEAPAEHAIHRITMGQEFAEGLGAALGTSAELWLNLDRSYRACVAKFQGGEH